MANHSRTHPLDNVVWSALTSAHAALARGQGLARHYPREIAPFAAIAEASARAYGDLAKGLDPGGEARLFRPLEEPAPPGWETLSARPIVQMVADDRQLAETAPADGAIETLALAHVPEMLALVEMTKPGPFAAGTIRLGAYVGLRDRQSGTLLAMAGERFRLPGHTEISAICTHPAARGRRYGRILTAHLMQRIALRGEIPFLHVYPDNPAVALYRSWGFRERTCLWVIQRRCLEQ
jgi:ribosomal protein S18 acetylase RimI-like enzyme